MELTKEQIEKVKRDAHRFTNAMNSGPAFPLHGHNRAPDGHHEYTETQTGMTLRDYFAAKAMASIFTGPGAQMVADRDQRYNENNWAKVVALNAYEMADAMLDARAERYVSADEHRTMDAIAAAAES